MKRILLSLLFFIINISMDAQTVRDPFTYSDGTIITGQKKWKAIIGFSAALVDSGNSVRAASTTWDVRGGNCWDSLMQAGTEVAIKVARLGNFTSGSDGGVFYFMSDSTFGAGNNGYVCRAPISNWLRFGTQSGTTEWGTNTTYNYPANLAVGDTIAFRVRSLNPFTVGIFRYRTTGVRDSLGNYSDATYNMSAGFKFWLANGVDTANGGIGTFKWDDFMAFEIANPPAVNQAPTISSLTHSPVSPNKKTIDSLVSVTVSASDAGPGAGLDSVKIYIDGVLDTSTGAIAGTSLSLSTRAKSYNKGTHTYSARIRDDSSSVTLEPISGTKTFYVDSTVVVTSRMPIWMHINPWGVNINGSGGTVLASDIDYTLFDYLIMVGMGFVNGNASYDNLTPARRLPFNQYVHSRGKPILLTYGGDGTTAANFGAQIVTYGLDTIINRVLREIDNNQYDGISWDFEPFNGADTTAIKAAVIRIADSLTARTSAYTATGKKLTHFSIASNYGSSQWIAQNAAGHWDKVPGQVMDMSYDLSSSTAFSYVAVWHNNAVYELNQAPLTAGWTCIDARFDRWKTFSGTKPVWAVGVDMNAFEFAGGRTTQDPSRGAAYPGDLFSINPTTIGDYQEYVGSTFWNNYGVDTATSSRNFDNLAKATYFNKIVPPTGLTPWTDEKFGSFNDSISIDAIVKYASDSGIGGLGVWAYDEGYLTSQWPDRSRRMRWVKVARDKYAGTTDTVTRSITSLSPSTKTAGDGSFTLTVNGTNLKSGDSVFIGGIYRTTTWVSPNFTGPYCQLTVAAQATDISTAGNKSVYLRNGVNTSNTIYLTVNASTPRPTIITSIPSTVGQGAVNYNINIGGSDFKSDITILPITGITVNAITFISSSSITISVTVSGSATVGNRDIIVKNVADNLLDTLTNGLAVTSKPSFSYSVPNNQLQGTTQSVMIVGSGFLPTVSQILFSGSNVTATNIVRSNSTTLNASITVDAIATTGTRDITIVNSDGGRAIASGQYLIKATPIDTIPGGSVSTYDANRKRFVLSGEAPYRNAKDVTRGEVANPTTGKVNIGDDFVVRPDGSYQNFIQRVGIDGGPLSYDTTIFKGSDGSIEMSQSNDTVYLKSRNATTALKGSIKINGILDGTADSVYARVNSIPSEALISPIGYNKLPGNIVIAPAGANYIPVSSGTSTPGYTWQPLSITGSYDPINEYIFFDDFPRAGIAQTTTADYSILATTNIGEEPWAGVGFASPTAGTTAITFSSSNISGIIGNLTLDPSASAVMGAARGGGIGMSATTSNIGSWNTMTYGTYRFRVITPSTEDSVGWYMGITELKLTSMVAVEAITNASESILFSFGSKEAVNDTIYGYVIGNTNINKVALLGGITPSTSYILEIIITLGNVVFKIDGNTKATITTNLPAGSTYASPIISAYNYGADVVGSGKQITVDYYYFKPSGLNR